MVGLDNPLHIALVLVVVLMVFGAKRLPEMGKSMGAGLRGFKDSLQGNVADDDHSVGRLMTQATEEPAPAPARTAPAPAPAPARTPVGAAEGAPPAA
jgi:sec-independent protein translocase protein TatA